MKILISLFLASLPGLPAAAGASPAQESALHGALTAMRDSGGSVGEQAAHEIEERAIKIKFRRQERLSTFEIASGNSVVIYLSDALPPAPRVLAPLLAREVGLMAASSMIESAESHYLWHSLMARAWMELGGEPRTLPVIDEGSGYADQAMAAEIGLWFRARYDVTEISRFHRVKTIAELKSEVEAKIRAGDDVFRGKMIFSWLERDQGAFRRLVQDEREWILSR